MTDSDSITHDPIFYGTVAFFALLTTALPALLGQLYLLPILQTISLTAFIAIALHHRHSRGALTVMMIWLPIQFILLTLLSRFFIEQLEAAIPIGFLFRGEITAWFFAGTPYPAALLSEPMGYLLEIVGIILGSLATAGLVGIWILVRLLNQAAYGTGILLASLANPGQSLLVIPYWTLLRAGGYAGLIVVCAEPLLTYNWSPSYYWQHRRKLMLVSLLLVVLGLVTELLLPTIVARPPLP